MSALALRHLWNATAGCFWNRLSKASESGSAIERMSPNQFYPLLAGPPAIPESVARTATLVALTSNAKMALWKNATPPAALPPVYARPLVQYWAAKSDARGDGDEKGPHALCCTAACNALYSGSPSANYVQRTHGKVRMEGMALGRVAPAVRARYSALGAAPVALYGFSCSGGLKNTSDVLLARAGWTPGAAARAAALTCARATAPSAWVLPARVGPGAATLVELQLWYRRGDHYVVGSAAGIADAKARGYAKQESLGWVWPPPGSADAASRYALPSMSKDDSTYISQQYWRGRAWAPMAQLVYWGLSQYGGVEARGATDALVAQSKALLLRAWYGYDSDDGYSGTGRRVYENLDADTGEGYSYSSSAFPLYGWGALNGFMGLVHNGFYDPLPPPNATAAASV